MKIKAQAITGTDFAPYGRYYNLLTEEKKVLHSIGDGFEDHMTAEKLIDTEGHLGYTIGDCAPYRVSSMEKHSHTEEALFCAGEPVLLAVAVSQGELPPRAEDIRAFILNPGDVAVLRREVWHDACHGIHKKTGYYYLASRGAAPAEWIEVSGDAEIEIE